MLREKKKLSGKGKQLQEFHIAHNKSVRLTHAVAAANNIVNINYLCPHYEYSRYSGTSQCG